METLQKLLKEFQLDDETDMGEEDIDMDIDVDGDLEMGADDGYDGELEGGAGSPGGEEEIIQSIVDLQDTGKTERRFRLEALEGMDAERLTRILAKMTQEVEGQDGEEEYDDMDMEMDDQEPSMADDDVESLEAPPEGPESSESDEDDEFEFRG